METRRIDKGLAFQGSFRVVKCLFVRATGRLRSKKAASAPIVPLMVSPGGERKHVTLAFFTKDSCVVRFSRARRFDSEYIQLRQKFATFVPSASLLAIDESEFALREEYVCGSPLSHFADDDEILIQSASVIFAGLHGLILDNEGQDCTSHFAFCTSLDTSTFGGNRRTREALEFLSPVRCIPSHGDLHALNIIVREDFGGIVAIDFDSIQLRPQWFDAVRYVQYEVGRPLRKGQSVSPAVVEALDHNLEDLVKTATGRASLPNDWRSLLAVGYLTWRRWDRRGLGPRDTKVERDANDLQAWISAAAAE